MVLSVSGNTPSRGDFPSVAHDARVLQQALVVGVHEPRNPKEIEAEKNRSKILPLGQDRAPAQAGLKTFQAEFFEKAVVIIDGKAALVVVAKYQVWSGGTPAAARLPTGPKIVAVISHALRKASRSSVRPGEISRISAVTTSSTTKGSS